jgi:hypothetical protein
MGRLLSDQHFWPTGLYYHYVNVRTLGGQTRWYSQGETQPKIDPEKEYYQVWLDSIEPYIDLF